MKDVIDMLTKKSTMLLALAFFVALLSVFSTRALTTVSLDRNIDGGAVVTPIAQSLTLTGFPSQATINNKYTNPPNRLGTLVNNGSTAVTITVFIDPNVIQTGNANTNWSLYTQFVNAAGVPYAPEVLFKGKGVQNPAGKTSNSFTLPAGATVYINVRSANNGSPTVTTDVLFRFTGTVSGNQVILERTVRLFS